MTSVMRTKGRAATAVTFSCELPPAQMVDGVAVTLATVGEGLTTTVTLEGADEQPAADAVKV
ncbi:MAG: hypothetical protein V9F04_05275 [Dermatophilaceae bacterium]